MLGFLLVTGLVNPGAGLPATAPPAKGDPFPAVSLPAPPSTEDRNYLGLTGSGSFKLSQVKATVVLIEIFSMYCPFCQKDAPGINELYRTIENDPQLKGKIKLIGIGAGNTTFEVDVYKKTYQVPFPLLPDEDFTLHKALGETRTPYFIVVKLEKGAPPRVVYSELAGFKAVDSFLQTIKQSAGLK
jgi:peroxiredoxin